MLQSAMVWKAAIHAAGISMSREARPRRRSRACWCLAVAIVCGFALPRVASAQVERAPIRNSDRLFSVYVWSYKEIREQRVVMQKYDYSCGAAALCTVIRYYWGDPIEETYFLGMLPKLGLDKDQLKDRIENGLTLTDLRNMTIKAGYEASMGKVKFSELAQSKVPVVVGITVRGHDHFAVFRGTDGIYAYLADPLRGNMRTPVSDFLTQWQRNAILVVAKPNTPVKKVNPMGVGMNEMERGWLNAQLVRKNGLVPLTPSIMIGP